MSYTVTIRNNETGEVRTSKPYTYDWHRYWWADGNMSCDCNRHREFLRAGGRGPAGDPFWNKVDTDCSEGAYSVLYADLDDGTRVIVDDIDPTPELQEDATRGRSDAPLVRPR